MKLLALALLPTLLASTAVYAQDDTHPYFALSATGGAVVMKMPSGQNGVLTQGNVTVTGNPDPLVIGETLGLSMATSLGRLGDYDTFMGANLFASYGNVYSSGTQSFSGIGTVYIPGLSTPANGSISLTTTRTAGSATAGATVGSTSPQGTTYGTSSSASSGPGVGGQSDADVSTRPADPSFQVSGSNTQVAAAGATGTALAYGGIADTSGSLLIITGDLDGLKIATSVRNTILYAGADITFGASGAFDSATAVQAYVGPSYRYLGQWTTTTTGASMTVDIPEVAGQTAVHPLWVQTLDGSTNLNSSYFGGVFGLSVSHRIADNVSVTLGGEGSLYYASAHLHGRETVTTTGGVAPGGTPSPTVTVPMDPVDVTDGGLAYAVRGQLATTVNMSPNIDLTAALTVDYLSKVARPYGGASVSGSGGNASWSSGSQNSLISFGDMLAFTGTATLTGHF